MPRNAATPSRVIPRTVPPVMETVGRSVGELTPRKLPPGRRSQRLGRGPRASVAVMPPSKPRALVPMLIFLSTVVAVISSLGAPLVPDIAASTHVPLADAQWALTVTLLVAAVATP